MSKYSRNKLRNKKFIIILSVIVLVIAICITSYYIYINNKNYISYSKVDESGKHVSDNIAKNSTPIIVNNIIIGALYNDTFVDKIRYMNMSENREGLAINIYGVDGLYGEYTIDKISYANNYNYISSSRLLNFDEYYAVDENISALNNLIKLNTDKDYTSNVKDALGKYYILNSTINITDIYSAKGGVIISAISDVNSSNAYSCIVYVKNGKNNLLKYNFVNNKKDSDEFGILTPKFATDLNSDGYNDVIIQETKEFETRYIVISGNGFKEVLSVNIK